KKQIIAWFWLRGQAPSPPNLTKRHSITRFWLSHELFATHMLTKRQRISPFWLKTSGAHQSRFIALTKSQSNGRRRQDSIKKAVWFPIQLLLHND
ncbi:MAG: hypothetical protein IJL99_00285, partial [Firmicutes bacterium]|nr:hypothetical protein [Bacillota bacterium]